MSQLEQQMRHRDREMVPKFLVQAMFSLMIIATGLVAYAQWAGVPQVGVLAPSPVTQSRDVVLIGDRKGVYEVRNPDGTLVAVSSENKAGFIGVIGRVIDRERQLHGVKRNPVIQIVRRENGHVAIIDPTTGMDVALIGYGQDNVAAFARLLD